MFDTRETSLSDGQPVRLYEFAIGATTWRHAAADTDLEFEGQTYAAEQLTDDGVRQTGESNPDELVITGPAVLPVALLFRSVPPAVEVDVVVRNAHFGEAETIVAFTGTVISVRRSGEERAELRCQTLSSSFARPGLRLGWERGCPHALYDDNCRVDREMFRTNGVVSALDGVTIQAAAFAGQVDGWFAGGYVEWSAGAYLEQRLVTSHVGDSLTLMGGTDGLEVGIAASAFPGCARTIQVCNDKFGNLENYGGVPHMPGKSPFDGDPVF